jgi:hypothetical protein
MKNLIWKPVNGYEDYYEVSNTGLVRSIGRYQEYKRKPSSFRIHLKEIEALHKDGYGSYQIGRILSDKYKYNHDSVRAYCGKVIKNKYKDPSVVFRPMKSKILHPNDNSNGYKFVNLSVCNKIKIEYVHRIVASSFIGNIPKGYHVNHIDKNRDNNNLQNLEIVCPSSNSAHANLGVGSSKYPAVSWNKSRKKWIGMFKSGGESFYCGGYETEEEAFNAVLSKAKELGKDLGKYYDHSIINLNLFGNNLSKSFMVSLE